MKVISFCIYGSNDKYCQGLNENLKLIQSNLQDYLAFIYVGDNVSESWITQFKSYPFVQIFFTNINGMYNRCQRFLAIDNDNVDIAVIRDTDSRLHERDIWCIRHFENSSYKFHAIRDHPDHGALILAGLWGIKKTINLNIQKLLDKYLLINNNINYVQYDQYFLRDIVYPLVNTNMIIYTFNERMKMKQNETILKIPLNVVNDDFCGLAITYDDISGQEVKEYKWNYGFECNVCNKFCGSNKCGKCGTINYCSRNCQVLHWKTHKLNCSNFLSNIKSIEE